LYYLGLIAFTSQQDDEAKALFVKAVRPPDYAAGKFHAREVSSQTARLRAAKISMAGALDQDPTHLFIRAAWLALSVARQLQSSSADFSKAAAERFPRVAEIYYSQQ